jgi:hypothetical protein
VPLANIYHVGYTGAAPVASDLVSFATAFANVLVDKWIPSLNSAYTLDEVIVTDIASDSGQVGSYSSGAPGVNSDAPISAGSALLVNWQIIRRYRGGKPRTYLPPPTYNRLATPSTWDDSATGNAGVLAAALLALCSGGTFGAFVTTSLGCVSYRSGDAARVDPLFEPFTGYSVGSLVRTQRRRITASSF